MTRFGTPSPYTSPTASTIVNANARVAALALKSEGSASAGPSKLKKLTHKGGKSRSRGKMSSLEIDRARAVIKKQQRKKIIAAPQWSYVFVGNLNPSINEVDLEKAFKHCGTIVSIVIRVSSGHVAIVAPGDYKYSPADRQYATVQFTEPAAAKRAKRMNGRTINGRRIVVCYDAIDLPETKDAIQKFLAKNEPDEGIEWKTYFTALKHVTVARNTSVASKVLSRVSAGSPQRQLKTPQAMVSNLSFPRTVM